MIPTPYIPRVMKLLGALPWKDHIKGLSLWLNITDMATFLLQDWLSDAHVDSMLGAAMHLHCDTLSHMVPCTELILSDFVTHILASPLLETSPIPSNYAEKAPKSVQRLGSIISECSSAIRVATCYDAYILLSISHPFLIFMTDDDSSWTHHP
jgi:hypothetical protein